MQVDLLSITNPHASDRIAQHSMVDSYIFPLPHLQHLVCLMLGPRRKIPFKYFSRKSYVVLLFQEKLYSPSKSEEQVRALLGKYGSKKTKDREVPLHLIIRIRWGTTIDIFPIFWYQGLAAVQWNHRIDLWTNSYIQMRGFRWNC